MNLFRHSIPALAGLPVLAGFAVLPAQGLQWAADDAMPGRTSAVYWDVTGDRLVAVSDWPVRTWSFDGQRWRKHQPSGIGDAYPDTVLLYAGFDTASSRGLVVTGQGPSVFLTRTHLATGAGFFLRRPHSSPFARDTQPAVDPLTGDLVVFGGGNLGFQPIDDMWAWNGNSWRMLSPAVRPTPRLGAGMVTDRARNRVVLFGGVSHGQNLSDTWEWNGSQWSQLQPATSPSARRTRLAFDPAVQRAVMLGGKGPGSRVVVDCWEWDGGNWHAAPPLPEVNQAFGCDDGSSLRLVTGYASVWRRTATGWSPQFADPRPEHRVLASHRPKMAWDGIRGEIVMPMRHPFGDTWRYDGSWQRATTQGPPPRQGFGFAALGSGFVLFGGVDDQVFPRVLQNDTWSWNGQAWANLQPPVAPTPRHDAGMASDGTGILLFGGTDNGSTGMDETWRFDGASWTQLVTATVPPPRYAPAMVHDPIRNRIVLFGGVDASTMRDDTFEWIGTNWVAMAPTNSPTGGGLPATFHAGKGRVVVASDRLWEWDGIDWSSTFIGPTLGGPGEIAYFPPTGRLIGRRLWDTHTLTATPARVELVAQSCGNAPDLRLLGRPVPGTAPEVHVEGHPSAVTLLAYGLQPDQQSLAPGCDVLVQPLATVVGVTDVGGQLDVPLTIPADPSLRGVALLQQAAVLDGGPVFGGSLSARLRVVIGD